MDEMKIFEQLGDTNFVAGGNVESSRLSGELGGQLAKDHDFFSRSAPLAHSLKTFFLNLPVLVFGSSFTTSTSLGTMNLLIPL